LRTLGEAVTDLSGLDVKTIQPRLNALKRYAQARASIAEDDLYAQVFEPVFRRFAEQYPHTGAFSVAATCEACEVALARHVGEPVEVLREALRPAAGRGAPVDPSVLTTGTSDTDTATTDRPAVSYEAGEVVGAPAADELLTRVRRFADAVGLGGVLHPEPQSATGLRLSTLPADDAAHPERERAWWLLAGLLGQFEPNTPPPASLAPGFLHWLIDSEDASATAFWELLTCVRRAGGVHRTLRAAGGSVSSSEEA
jgi:hypothetical protein